ncbi:hypothetical protein FKM82_022291 [Ascaphus truei]
MYCDADLGPLCYFAGTRSWPLWMDGYLQQDVGIKWDLLSSWRRSVKICLSGSVPQPKTRNGFGLIVHPGLELETGRWLLLCTRLLKLVMDVGLQQRGRNKGS